MRSSNFEQYRLPFISNFDCKSSNAISYETTNNEKSSPKSILPSSKAKQLTKPSGTLPSSSTIMSSPVTSGTLPRDGLEAVITRKSTTYVLSDLGFLDKLSKKGRAEVLKNLRQIPGANEAQADVASQMAKKCYFFTMPIEVRNMIYEVLLVKPLLGQADYLPEKTIFGARTKYRLEAAILRASRQISSESLKILYRKNTFFISNVRTVSWAAAYDQPTLISAITRYLCDLRSVHDTSWQDEISE
ncbi:hypothetical protein N431DRAFT_452979 [Stipitochalara longipes BDJ]|nr:hypothetical protein N431DRAFT_452979 [Stipitochalara longipes BDJ]